MRVSKPTVLLLGGISEAYELAEQLYPLPLRTITSLAGRTDKPRIPQGEWRSGGFGGVDGLVDYLKTEQVDLVIDATHPFATEMTKHAVAATYKTDVPFLRLERPLWQKKPNDNWLEVATLEEAAALMPKGKRIFLALGRQHLAPFLLRHDCTLIARMVEEPDIKPDGIEIILAKPGTTAEEKAFLDTHAIDMIIARNSGGERSYGKIEAAGEKALPIIMISRAPLPKIQLVTTVSAAVVATRQAFGLCE